MNIWRQVNRKRNKFVRKYTRDFRRAIHSQIQPVLDNINSQFIDNYKTLIPLLVVEGDMKETYVNLYKEVGVEFRKNLAKQIKSRGLHYLTKDMEDDVFEEEMENYALLLSRQSVRWMTDSTRAELLRIIEGIMAEGRAEGWPTERLTTEIRHQVEYQGRIMERWRSRRIAQTEVMSASNNASFRSAQNSGLRMKKVWITAPEGVAKTERHNLIAGLQDQRPYMDEPFNLDGVLMQHPGDPDGGAENVCNCRCCIAYEPE